MLDYVPMNLSKALLSRLHRRLLGLQRCSLRWPKSVVLVSLLVFVAAVVLSRQIHVGIRAEDWLDPHAPSTQKYLKMKEDFGSEDRLTWIVPTAWTTENFCRLQRQYVHWTESEVHLNSAATIFDLRAPEYRTEKNLLFYPLLLKPNCEFTATDIIATAAHPLADVYNVKPGADILFQFTLKELASPTKWGTVDFAEAKRWSEKLRAAEPQSFLGGSLFFQQSTKEGIEWAGKLNLLTALVIVVLCRVFLGTWLSGFLLAVMVFLTTSFLQAGMVLRKELVDPLSSSLFILMAMAVIEDYFFVFHLTRLKGIPFRRSLRRMLLPGFLTSLTTAVGFGALTSSDNLSVQNLGFWAAVGTMIEWAMVFLWLPALTRLFPTLNEAPRRGRVWRPAWLTWLGDVKPNRKAVWLLCLPLLSIFYTFNKVNINYTPFDMFPTSHPLVEFRDYMKSQRGFEGDVSLMFDKTELTNEDLAILREIAKDPLVVEVKDPLTLVDRLMPANADPALGRLIRSEINQTPLFKTYHSKNQTRAQLFVRSIDIRSIEKLTRHVELICQGKCYLNGEIIAFQDYALSMLQTLYSSFLSSLLPVLLLMAFLCHASSGRILWPILLSTLWAPLMLLILVSLFQIKVNVVTCLAMALLTGLAGDNAIQFLFFDRHGRWTQGLKQLKHSSLLMFVVMTAISSVLCLSYFRSARILSGLIVLGIFLLLIGDLWILNHFTSSIEKPDRQE
jgi:predicted RND superfamily exporter protein